MKNIISQYFYNSYLKTLETIHSNYKKIYKVTFLNVK